MGRAEPAAYLTKRTESAELGWMQKSQLSPAAKKSVFFQTLEKGLFSISFLRSFFENLANVFFFFWEERIFQRGKMVFVLCLFLQLLFSPSVIAVVIFPICLCTNHVPFPILLPLTCSPPGFCLDVLKGCNTARVSD